jgi:hypothetical protein
VISSRRGDQIPDPDPDAEATPGIAPSDPLATVLSSMTSSRVLRRASKFAAAEDDARNPRRTRGGVPRAVRRFGGAASRDGEEEEGLRQDGVKGVEGDKDEMEGEGRRRRPYAFLTVAVRLSSARASRLLWYCSTHMGGGVRV